MVLLRALAIPLLLKDGDDTKGLGGADKVKPRGRSRLASILPGRYFLEKGEHYHQGSIEDNKSRYLRCGGLLTLLQSLRMVTWFRSEKREVCLAAVLYHLK